MKKICCFLLAVLFGTCLVACGSNASSTSDAGNSSTVENNAQEVMDDAQQSEADSSGSNSSEPSSIEDSTNTEGISSDTDVNIFKEDEISNEEREEDVIMQQNAFYVSVGGKTFSATLADNSGAQALKELLTVGDMTIQMSDYGGFEKVGSLGQSLPTENSQTTTQAGDIVLYQGDQIVIFYGSNSWSYTRLGKVDDLTGWKEAMGGEDIAVTFSLQGE